MIRRYDDPARAPGALSARLATDCYAVRSLAGERAATSAQLAVTLVAGLGVSFAANWRLTLVVLALVPVIGGVLGAQGAVIAEAADAARDATRDAGAHAAEALRHVRTCASLGLEARVADKFDALMVAPRAQFVCKGVVTGLCMGLAGFVILAGAGFQYYVGGLLYGRGLATFPQIMKVLLCTMFSLIGLGQIAADAADKADAAGAAASVHELLEEASAIDALDDAAGARPADVSGRVEFRGVEFAYPARPDAPVYRGVDLTLEAGQTVALVGPSGSGKSTAVALLERFYDPDAGAVTLDGRDLRELNVAWLRAQIGLVSQEPVLFGGTVRENIAHGKADATDAEIEAAAKLANAHDFVAALPEGYETPVGEQGVQLSGGQKQRVAIARAIVRDPAILVLDEATSALDAASERAVQEALDGLLRARQRTTLVIAHRLSTVRGADLICVFDEGRVVERGTHDELMASESGRYRALVATQLAGAKKEPADDDAQGVVVSA